MSETIDNIRDVVQERSDQCKQAEGYDFWNEHIKLVVKNALDLADKYNADREIVELGALLHDIALVSRVGDRNEHNERGAEIAVKLLEEYNYPKDRTERVRKCVLHHRNSHNSTSVEETCVADADILAHFDNIPMIFSSAFVRNQLKLEDKKQFIEYFEKDFYDLSETSQKEFRARYEVIMSVLFPDETIKEMK